MTARWGGLALLVATLVSVVAFATPGLRAAAEPGRAEVVLVVDLSASILADKANRGRFAAALEGIADRVDATTADLVAGDATMSIVEFATTARDEDGCVDLHLANSPPTVRRFADCLRGLARTYRTGPSARLADAIGVDTNYVAAMQRAAVHLSADAERPALILLTDGRHDAPGVPATRVLPARDSLFGARSPFALLPVGMGLDPAERGALEEALVRLRIVRNIPACSSGVPFSWPQVVFRSPAAAGRAVALALQDVTCTFTVAPSPSPSASPTRTRVPTPVRSIALAPGDGSIAVSWLPGAAVGPDALHIDGYRVRCVSDATGATAGTAETTGTSAEVRGLTNGATYRCEVASVSGGVEGAWIRSTSPAIPRGRPTAPPKPAVVPLDHAIRAQISPVESDQATRYSVECSSDGGSTWTPRIDVGSASDGIAEVDNVANEVDYVCRAFAANTTGTSDPSALSDVVRPCGSALECEPLVRPAIVILAILLVAGLLMTGFVLYRSRGGYVVAVVDGIHTANLGSGGRLGISLVRAVPHGPVTDVVSDRGRHPDITVRRGRDGRFVVSTRHARTVANDGVPVVVVVQGVRHEVVLRGFSTRTAALASNRG